MSWGKMIGLSAVNGIFWGTLLPYLGCPMSATVIVSLVTGGMIGIIAMK